MTNTKYPPKIKIKEQENKNKNKNKIDLLTCYE